MHPPASVHFAAAAVLTALLAVTATGTKHKLRHRRSGPTLQAAYANRRTYSYPKTDNLLLCFSQGLRHKLSPAHDNDTNQLSWEDPELGFWLRSQAYMTMTPRHDYLDVGCGMGRIVAKFGGLFKMTTCLEPDSHRVAEASTTFGKEHFYGRIVMAHTRFLEFEAHPASYDVITCVQVFQHLPLAEPGQWFERMYSLLRPNGVLIVATTVGDKTSYKATDASGSWDINATDFENRASNTTHAGALPVHHFTRQELADLAEDAGFDVIEQNAFSYWGSMPFSQYLIAVKNTGWVKTLGGPPQSPPVANIHISGMEEWGLMELQNVRSGKDNRCKK